MSKILMNKINNILNIDKDKEYINFSLHQKEEFIDLSKMIDASQLSDFILNVDEIELIFKPNYNEILEKIKSFDNFNDLNEYLIEQEIDYKYESKLFGKNSKKQSKTKNKKKVETSDKQLALLEEEFLFNKKKIYEDIKNILLSNVNKFDLLNKKAKKSFVEQGKQLLRFAFDFIEGNINDVYINAPLFLFDMEIQIKENNVKLIKTSEKKLNDKLILFILKQLEIDYQKYDFDSLNSKENIFNLFEELLHYKIKNKEEIEKSINEDSYRTLKYLNKCILGLFDTEAGKIKEDFIELMNNNVTLLNEKMNNDFEFYTKEEFKDNALIQINNPLNIYQKYAVRSAINENTLIYGPPGTGKSEIITSIVANLLMKSKSILIVSEKEAALEVIKKRLNHLSIFAFYLKDIEDEELFYSQIEEMSNYMGSFYNEKYKNENFNLDKTYQENDRVIDYNEEISKFRQILFEDIEFSLEKDSRNNDYRDYLLSIKQVEEFVKENKTGVDEFWKEYENKFVKLQSATEFISKVAEFNWFKEKYELNEEETKKLDLSRQELNRFIAENNLIDFKLDTFEAIKNKVELLNDFLHQQMLHKDKDFMSTLENDYHFMLNNFNQWNKVNNILENIKDREYIKKFLLRYSARHEKFLTKYISLSNQLQNNLLQRYYYKGEISTSKLIFKSKKDTKTLKALLEVIQEFEKIKLFKTNTYLDNLTKLDKSIINPIIIYFYNHPNLLKKSFIEFYNQQILNFDQRIIHQYYKYRVNQIERELININVYNFEKVNKNKHIIERDIPYLISRYLKNNHDFILNIDKSLKQIYLKYIKNILAKSSIEIQEKVEKMFKVVRMEIKPRINDFIYEFLDCLKIIFPIWISKPELISYYVPNEKGIYDVGIFDEASQMFLEKAYPMIYRCKQLIVAGDDKQLKPERIQFNELILDLENRPLVNEIEFDWSESLLDRVKVSYWNTYTLRNHYRSLSKELIEFSNNNFYENKLLFSNINNNEIIPLEIINQTKFKEKDLINKEEAKSLLLTLKREINNFSKILVICFTTKQKEYLQELIEKSADSNLVTRIKRKLLVIGDLQSVQGDEGDLVIISCVFSKESDSYGLLSSLRGENYLNVAITRAKKKMIVFKSLNNQDVKFDLKDQNESIIIFKKWIKYLDAKQKEKINNETKMTNNVNLSSFKKEVYETIKNDVRLKDINVVQNLAIGSINIDLGLYVKSINNIDLLIILDDWKKNITIQDWFEDIDQEEYLKSRNYQVMRIREQDWLKDNEIILEKIMRKVKSKYIWEEIVKIKSKKGKKDKK